MSATSRLYRILFFAIAAFYCLFFARFGFENWDTGFVSSQSWRVSQGEQAFRDFLSVRPPVTAYFHGWIMAILPDYGQVYFTRILGYVLFVVQVCFVVGGLDRLYSLERFRISKWGAMTIGFVLATGAIYPDPWFTVDGIFFASAAFYTLAMQREPGVWRLALSAILCVLSAGTKQSFYFVPIFFTAWIFLSFGWKKSVFFVGFLMLFATIFLSCLLSATDIGNVLNQVAGTGSSRDFIDLGFLSYLNVFRTKLVWASLILLSFGFAFVNSGNRLPSHISVLKWLAFATFLSALAAIPIFGFAPASTILLIATVIAFCRKTKWNRIRISRYFPLAVLVGISWCAALSKGFPYPVLYVHALIFAFFILMYDDFGRYHISRLYLYLAVPVGIFLFIGNFQRYREQDFTGLHEDLGVISPKLAFVISSDKTLEKLSDLKNLRKKYPEKYIVCPSLPQAYYLFNDRNPLAADWLTTFELKGQSEIYLHASLSAGHIFVERSFIEGEIYLDPKSDKDDFSQYANYVARHLKPVEKTKHFLVYETSGLVNVLRKYPIRTTQ